MLPVLAKQSLRAQAVVSLLNQMKVRAEVGNEGPSVYHSGAPQSVEQVPKHKSSREPNVTLDRGHVLEPMQPFLGFLERERTQFFHLLFFPVHEGPPVLNEGDFTVAQFSAGCAPLPLPEKAMQKEQQYFAASELAGLPGVP